MSLPLLAEGKTKIYRALTVEGFHKDDMTAGNGARHEIVPGKGEWCNTINDNVFKMLKRHRAATTYVVRTGPQTFKAEASAMLPYEVVIRFKADGSALKREPSLIRGQRFSRPRVEFYLKTSGKQFNGIEVPDDDPFISAHNKTGIWVNHPGMPLSAGAPQFIPAEQLYGLYKWHDFTTMTSIIRRVAGLLQGGWLAQQCQLVDLKLEFDDQYRVSDVITPDEWRLFGPDGQALSKQPFRDGASIEEMQRIYAEVARRSRKLSAYTG